MYTFYINLFILGLLTTSCFKVGITNSGTSETPRNKFKTVQVLSVVTEGGGASASISTSSTTNQLLKATEGSTIQGSSAVFPPGALSINTAITIEESASIATASFTSELNIDTTISQSGTAVSVKPDKPIDASQPFALSIPLPVGGNLALTDTWSNLVVMYRVTVQASNKTVVGVIPRSSIIIKDGVAEIETLYFGSFQTAVTSIPVTDKIQADSSAPILTKFESASLPAISVASRSPFVAKANGVIEINGINFRPTMIVAVGGKKVSDLKVLSDSKASFVASTTVGFGLNDITVDQDGVSQTVSILYAGAKSDLPIMLKAETEVCAGEKYYDELGALKVGTRTCNGSLAACTSEGQFNCTATAEFPAVPKAGIAVKVVSGQTLAGVTGTGSNRPADCAVDGDSGCVVVGPTFGAALKTGLSAKIVTGFTVAGVGGVAVGRPADCASDGAQSCVATSNFPAVDKINNLTTAKRAKILNTITVGGVTGTLNTCSVDGESSCYTVVSFPAMATAGAAVKIANGETLGGVPGSASARPTDCSIDGDINCVAVAGYPAIDKVSKLSAGNLGKIRSSLTIAGMTGTLADCSSDGEAGCVAIGPTYAAALKTGLAAKIISGQAVAGVAGSASPRPGDCSADGQITCVTVGNFPAIDKLTKLSVSNAAKIRSNLTIAGVNGTLSDCAADGSAGCVVLGPTYAAAITTGLDNKVISGQTVAGVAGTAASRPADCATDGGINCVAISQFPAIDKASNLAPNLSKIHTTVTLGGLGGTMTNCSADGVLGCLTVSGFPSANIAGAGAKIAAGDTLGGVTGTAGVRPSDCSIDGAVGCVATSGFPAADSAGAGAKIASGDVLAGIPGTAGVRPSDCGVDGAVGCVTVANFPAVDKITKLVSNTANIRSALTIAGVTGTLSNCSTDGGAGCVVVGPTYAAALVAGAATKILIGQNVAGVSGSAPSKPSDCSADGALACVTVASFPAASSAGASGKIVSGFTLAGIAGTATPTPPNCASDGATNCLAISAFPAVNKATNLIPNLAKIHTTVSVAGEVGTLADCADDGSTGCITIPAYRAAAFSGAAAKIVSGQSLAGVAGTAVPAPSNCAADGAINCVAISTFPAVNKAANLTPNLAKIHSVVTIAGTAGTLADCSVDGAQGCFTVSAFRAASIAGAGAKIIVGQTLAGVTGSASSSPASCSTDGAIGCVTVSAFPAVDKITNLAAAQLAKIHSSVTVGGITGTMASCSNDGATNCLTVASFPAAAASAAAAKILTGQTLAGIAGSAAIKPANCSADNESNCVATAVYPSVVKANVTSGVIKNGAVIAGVSGQYPSASFPLAGATAAADLDSATFNIKIKSSAPFEYWNATGVVQTGSGDSDILDTNIKNGIDIYGTVGSSGPNCTVDGATGCMTTTTFKAVNTAGISTWDIRLGKTAGGISGSLYYPKNGASLTTFNRTTGTAANVSTTVADTYDTIDDGNNNGSLPVSFPSGFPVTNPSNFVRDVSSDTGVGGGTASNGACDGTESCLYIDQLTKLLWNRATTTSTNWEGAIPVCENLTSGGLSTWRLPTQKELIQFFIDGGITLTAPTKLNLLSGSSYWTATTDSTVPGSAFAVDSTLIVSSLTKNATAMTLCVQGF